jgi:PPE-repeat protein
MTAPIWMAAPPEVHSALLSSGPGPGSLLAAAGAWSSLSTVYTETADELTALLDAVQAGTWDGPTAEAYVAAHAPYLTWLTQASADSAATAVQHETAATAYTTALAAMPTLAELAANHATHAVLLATNFFGINTIPIALNEADYARMWLQAASVMSAYQAVTSAAVAASPPATPAPQIVKSEAATSSDPGSNVPTIWDFFTGVDNLIEQTLPPNLQQSIGAVFWVLESPANLASQLQYNFPTTNIPTITWASAFQELFVLDPYYYATYWPTVISAAGNNPAMLLWASSIYTVQIGIDYSWEIAHVTYLLGANGLLTPAVLPLLTAPAGAAGGFAGLAGLAGLPHPAVLPSLPPAAFAPGLGPVLPSIPVTAATTPIPSPTPVPTSAAIPAAPTPPAPGAPPPSPVDPGAFSYLVGDLSMTAASSANASAKKKAPEPEAAATPVSVAAPRAVTEVRRRRRVTAKQLGRGYEYLDLEPEPTVVASDRGAGRLGFAGTVRKEAAVAPAGLITLADNAFGGGPGMPMMPGTWGVDSAPAPDPAEGAQGS